MINYNKLGYKIKRDFTNFFEKNSEKEDTIFMLELKECSKRIFGMTKFIFYALGYAIERVPA